MMISFRKPPIVSFLTILSIVVLLSLMSLAGAAPAKTKSSSPVMEITVQNDLISAELVDAPLIEVLQRIKQEFDFKAHFLGDLTEPITTSFTDLPLDKCLRLLTVNQSLSIATEIDSSAPEQSEAKQIAEVWVLSRSSTTANRITPPSGASGLPAPEAENDESTLLHEESLQQFDTGEQENISLDQILNNPSPEKSSLSRAIQRLVRNGDAASVKAMAAFLDNQDKEVRLLLVNGISSIHNEESTQVLGQVVQNESNPEIRKIALQALGQRKDDVTAQELLERARNDTDKEIRNMADQLLNQ